MTALVGREVKRTFSALGGQLTGLRRKKPNQPRGQYPGDFMKALLCAQRSQDEGVLSAGIHICNMMSPNQNNSRNNGLAQRCVYKSVSAQLCAGNRIDSGRDSNQNRGIARRPFSI
jgi:hypothetical protein